MITSTDIKQSLQLVSDYLEDMSGVHITYELQDKSDFILMKVKFDKQSILSNVNIRHDFIKNVAEKLNYLLPCRKSEYSWMLCVLEGEKMVDSVSGGWENMPIIYSF